MTARVELERHGPVLVVSLSDEEGRYPVYDGSGLKAIAAAWAELDADDSVRAAVLRSSSPDAFCVGADLAVVTSGGFDDPPYPEVAEVLARKPVVVAIEGRCLGGGMMIACGGDLRVAGAGATFGLPEARWNLPAQWLGALARQMSPAHALEVALLADEHLPATRLAEMGWLNRVVDDGTAFDAAMGWANRIAGFAPAALARFKELIWRGSWTSPDDALALGHRQARELMSMAQAADPRRDR